ncbi:MAG: LOG family protein [Gammaproteobacteria bacterium]
MGKINRLCVFCGANRGARQEYVDAANHLARLLASANIGLVYGGARVGLMGQLADSMLHFGGEVIGVMPNFIAEKEIAHEDITELHLVDTMHERKALMTDLSDGFIMLPGGTGTLDEFFEIMTWNQIGLHKKPYGILNTENYFDHLLKFLDHTTSENFLKPMYRNMVLVENTPEKLLEAFLNYREPTVFRLKQDILLETEQ